MDLTISTFYGLAPKLGANLPLGWATIARNLNLSTGKIRPLAKHKRISTSGGGVNELFYWNGAWKYGNDKFYTEWNYETLKLLFYLTGGTAKRLVGSEVDLGQELPSAAPTVALNGAGDLIGDFQYFYCTKRVVGGYTDLSGPSDVSAEITASSHTIRVTRGTISDSKVTHWWIYRVSSSTGEWNFVAEVSASASYYDDNISDDDVGEGPITYFDSPRTGNSVVLQGPPSSFDGLLRELHAGMLVGWSGSDIYFSEPTLPDLWELDAYRTRSPYPVKDIYELSGMLAVLTDHGPYRMDGTDPELMAFRKSLSTEPAVLGRAAAPSQRGLFYLSDSGIVLFDSIGTQIFSDSEFNEAWFKTNITSALAWIVYNDDHLFLGHAGGILVCDMRGTQKLWYELDTIATAGHARVDNGKLYLSLTDGIYEAHGLPYFMASDYMDWIWRSGDVTFGTDRDKRFGLVRVSGSGEVFVTAYVDGLQVGITKELTFGRNEKNRTLKLPRNSGRALQVELSGTGQIEEVYLEASL